VGSAVSIHPAVALIALGAGTELFGIWGAFFGSPIAGLRPPSRQRGVRFGRRGAGGGEAAEQEQKKAVPVSTTVPGPEATG
jgi:hypothetical protein